MQLSLDSKFIIYGASTRGKEYYKVIVRNKMTVLAFIDKDASKIQFVDGIPVYELKNLKTLSFPKQETILIISISNVFVHYDMAKKLFDMGYRYIIYKELTDSSAYGKAINKLYQVISIPYIDAGLEGLELPAFKEKQLLETEIGHDQFITKPIPIDLLFGLSQEFYLSASVKKNQRMMDLIPDKSLLYFTINKDMMRFFLHTVTEKEWNEYIGLYFEQRRCMISTDSIDYDEEENHLRDRYYIFRNMEMLYNTNINFFNDNPVEVQWNSKGYFNIQDGNNRAAFLLAKGWNMIPCRMSYEDYKIWENEKNAKEVQNYLRMIGMLEYPISNPFFSGTLSRLMPYCYLKLRKIGEWLYKSKMKVAGSYVLDAGCKNGFMGQFFARMGAMVTAVEQDIVYRELCERVNSLLFVKEELLPDYSSLRDKEYDIVLLPLWEFDHLQEILGHVKRALLIETTEREEVFKNTALTEYFNSEELCQYFCEDKIIHTIIFTKREEIYGKI